LRNFIKAPHQRRGTESIEREMICPAGVLAAPILDARTSFTGRA